MNKISGTMSILDPSNSGRRRGIEERFIMVEDESFTSSHYEFEPSFTVTSCSGGADGET
jgi:hypothetical protein